MRSAHMQLYLDLELQSALDEASRSWEIAGGTRRLWQGDDCLWTGSDESRWLGWLRIVEQQQRQLEVFERFRDELRDSGRRDMLLLGMGGSSLCPEVWSRVFGAQEGSPRLLVLDSTDPAQVRRFEEAVDLDRTLIIVASKSGTTLEPNALMEYFLERMERQVGRGGAGERFAAVTDPGSQLERFARERGFRYLFLGVPEIGGRFSALSHFGMMPAAGMGLPVAELLASAAVMSAACGADSPTEQNPGARLGLILGAAARQGRNKLSIETSPTLTSFGAWLEQLIAESTGKRGQAIIPIDGESPRDPAHYGDDRLFVSLRLISDLDPQREGRAQDLRGAGHPVIEIVLESRIDLGGELFRWEFATAVAGAVMRLNPFDQPDVEASKVATRRLTKAFEEDGSLPAEIPVTEQGPLQVFASQEYVAQLKAAGDDELSFPALLDAHLSTIGPGDYFALLAYLDMTEEYAEILQRIRTRVLDARSAATCLGFGPRFLHSTGQAYKGGPNTGVFLQITCDDANDLQVPGHGYSFGVIKAAQARGDFQVLMDRDRRALRVHLRCQPAEGLRQLDELVAAALQ